MSIKEIKKILILSFFAFFSASLLLCFSASFSYASDFISPNSSGEPLVIDVSNLNLLSGINVTVGEFTDEPRPYRDANTKSLVIFPPPVSSGEKTVQIQAGGSSVIKTVSFRPSPSGVLKNSLLPDLQEGRAGNTLTKISDGRVVLIGGSKSLAADPVNSLEVFNPEGGKSEYLKTPSELKKAKLQIPRSQHTATYLGISNSPLGKISGSVEQILVIGGFSQGGFLENTIEIVEIKVGTVQTVSTLLDNKKAKLSKARIFHTASLLPDGRVLIVGGQGSLNMTSLGALNSIEIFDPITKSIQTSGISLNTPRLLHTVTTLQDGDILISGGFTNEKQSNFGFGPATASCELIDSSNLSIKSVGSLVNNEGVGGHSATLLTNGAVLIFGGSTDFFAGNTPDGLKGLSLGRVQFYNPASETFNFVTNKTQGGNLGLQVPRFLHRSVLLPNGNVIVVGGLSIKAGLSSDNLVSNSVSTTEVFNVDLSSSSLEAEQKPSINNSFGRVLPNVVLVTPQNKTQGFLSASDSNIFTNSVVYVSGGFTNEFGKSPTKSSELIQIEANNGAEGRELKLSPGALLQGSYVSQFLIQLDNFSKVPSLKVEPQTINLSSSNNFMSNVTVLSTNGQIALLKAEGNTSIIVSPSLFQVGETVSISRKDSSVLGEFEINILPADTTSSFVPAKLKVNVSDSSKPFLATVPGFGISLSDQEGSNSTQVQVKVLSQDGLTTLSSIPTSTQVTATILDSKIANLGTSGVSSITGNLSTIFTVNALKPGKTNINFSINFPDVLAVSILLEVSGTPTFSNSPIDAGVLADLSSDGVDLSKASKQDSTSVLVEDLRLSSSSSLFPIYVPINFKSSIDNSIVVGSFTVRPIFGVDLFTATPRALVNQAGTAFRSPLTTVPSAIGGIVQSSSSSPLAVVAGGDGLRTLSYDLDVNQNLDQSFNMLSNITNADGLELFDFSGKSKILVLKGAMLFLLDSESGNVETTSSLSASGFELRLTEVSSQTAAVVSVGQKGIDLVFPVTDSGPRLVNFRLPGNTKNIAVVKKLSDKTSPFAVAYDGASTISIVDLVNVDAPLETIDAGQEKILKIDYAGKFSVNGIITDVLIAAGERKLLLYNLNNKSSIHVTSKLEIKSKIQDLLVIDGIAYLALGTDGILAVSVGSLINSDGSQAEITHFKKNKLKVVKSNGKETTVTKQLNATKLVSSKPFLLSCGENNNLTVIKVSP